MHALVILSASEESQALVPRFFAGTQNDNGKEVLLSLQQLNSLSSMLESIVRLSERVVGLHARPLWIA
jgi:hypothetical protein